MSEPRRRSRPVHAHAKHRPEAANAVIRRTPIIVVLAAALVIGGIIDRTGGNRAVATVPVVQPAPVAAPAQALSSSWFCAGVTGGSGALKIPGELLIANSSSAPAEGLVTLVSSSGSPVRIGIHVPADGAITVAENVGRHVAWVGAIVDIDSGGIAVDQQSSGLAGAATTPCATSGSNHWYFANGATLINAGVELSLLNPYPIDSVVDLSFTTDQGPEAPTEFQGLVVPAGGMLNVDLGSHLRRRQAIATTVTARTGRVVAWKTDWVAPAAKGSVLLGTPAANNPLADPAAPVSGATVTLGMPATGTSWVWPNGISGNGADERYLIYNPNPQTAQVTLSVGLDQGVAEPFQLSVGPYEVVPVVSDEQARIPAGVGHSAVLTSTNGVPVVAVRTLTGTQSAPWTGLGEINGGPAAAKQWLLAAGRRARNYYVSVVVYNPGLAPARVTVTGLTGGGGSLAGGTVLVQAEHRLAFNPGNVVRGDNQPLVVSADAPVYVEIDVYPARGGSGISLSFGVPLSQ